MEDGGVEIGDIVRGIDGVEADFVGGAVGDACFEAAAGHPDGEAVDMVIAAIGALGAWGATEFGGEDHEGVFEEAALGEVLEEAGDGLVDGEGEFGVIGFEGGVGVPGAGAAAAVLDLDEANAAFGEASGGEELGAEFAGVRQVHAVEGLGLRRFLREIENLWDGELHAGGEFVGGDAGGEGGIVGVFDASEGVEFLGEGEAEGLGVWGEWGPKRSDSAPCWQLFYTFPGFPKGQKRSRAATFFEKNRPSFWLLFFSNVVSPRKTQCLVHLRFWPFIFLICLELSKNALVCSFALLAPADHF